MVDFPPDVAKNPVYKYIFKQVYYGGMNFIILVNGLPRTGKSQLAQTFAWRLMRGTEYTGWKHLYDPREMIAWTKLDLLKKIKKFRRIGATIVWEEAGIAELGANAREFWSESNRGLSTLFQTMGFGRQIILITLPQKMMLDKHLRSLCHCIIDCLKVDKTRKRVIATIKWVEPSRKTDEPFEKLPRYRENKKVFKVKTIRVPLAPKHIIEEYYAQERVFKRWLQNRLAKEEARRAELKKQAMKTSREDRIGKVMQEVIPRLEEFFDLARNRLNIAELHSEFHDRINLTDAKIIARKIEKKIREGEIISPK